MHKANSNIVAVEWGSARRRSLTIDARGSIVGQTADDCGVLTLDPQSLETEIERIVAAADGAPVLLAGMIGSDRGWRLAPYAPCPADAQAIAAMLMQVRPGVAIVPGLSYEDDRWCDVMRGEEVQIMGALALGDASDCTICLPGAHSKWVRIVSGKVRSFRTTMTGEINGHLARAGVLAAMIAASAADDTTAFRAGVEHALTHTDLGAQLFHTRARVLLGRTPPGTVASYVSGLLIGDELRINLPSATGNLIVVGERAVVERHRLALEYAGRTSSAIDGEAAFAAGALAIASAAR